MKGVAKVVALGLALVASGAASAWWFWWKPAADAQAAKAALVQEVQERVSTVLNDPDSALFRNVMHFEKSGAGCGEVNAKNRMGGYVGYTFFVAFPDGDVRFAESMPARNFMTLLEANCPDEELIFRAAGIRIPAR
jgi:hypothetical protein